MLDYLLKILDFLLKINQIYEIIKRFPSLHRGKRYKKSIKR